ncbi:MAG: DUF1800 domain-containing protein [Verrucomicrobia bacterium]|nr:DUF1800 domain-containing protein [Verrucomicrobiota bacterium]
MKLCIRFVLVVLLASFLLPSRAATAAVLDLDHDGLDDLWQILFGAQGISASADSDGDGFTNREESLAGTDPFNANSRPTLRIAPGPAGGAIVSWDAVAGKRYALRSTLSLGTNAPSWSPEAQVIGDGGELSIPLVPDGASRFLRIDVDDVDSDADGLTDANERALGLNPGSDHSGRRDGSDLQWATNALRGPSVVTVAALGTEIYERWPDPGVFAIRRTGGLLPLVVKLAWGGTASFGVDYNATAAQSIQMPLGVNEVWVESWPIADEVEEPVETLTLTVVSGSGYSVGSSNSATISLINENASSPPNERAAARFLLQASFGPDTDSPDDPDDIPENAQEVMALGYEGWIDQQFARAPGYIQPWVDWAFAHGNALGIYGNWKENSWWGRVMGSPLLRPDASTNTLPDPLRQRVAFALSEILVISDRPEQLAVEQRGMANYYDLMVRHAFGNYRDLLRDVALHPAMGIYLSHLGNRKADPVKKIYPDENFAREVMQLFTIGLWELQPDGSRKLDSQGQGIPTYDNRDITEMARVFTGLSFGNNATFSDYPRDFTRAMKMWDAEHDCNAKRLLGGQPVPARVATPGNTGAAGLADVDAALDVLFNHANVGPFIGRQLIQRLVVSNPSAGYVARVAEAFADNGSGVRGDLRAVVKAILLDPEARDPAMRIRPEWGKLREPVLRVVNLAHAFGASSKAGWYLLDQFNFDHLQDPMNAPSVFNFFLPSYSPSGELAQRGLVAPEFQIINASSAITGPNYFWKAITGDLHHYGSGNPDYSVKLNLTNELAMIVPLSQIQQNAPAGPPMDPDPLIRRLDRRLTGGVLSPGQFQVIREAMLRVKPPTWEWHRERLRLAIYLIVTSPDYNVLR